MPAKPGETRQGGGGVCPQQGELLLGVPGAPRKSVFGVCFAPSLGKMLITALQARHGGRFSGGWSQVKPEKVLVGEIPASEAEILPFYTAASAPRVWSEWEPSLF